MREMHVRKNDRNERGGQNMKERISPLESSDYDNNWWVHPFTKFCPHYSDTLSDKEEEEAICIADEEWNIYEQLFAEWLGL